MAYDTKPVSLLPTGTAVSRYLMALGLGDGSLGDAIEVSRQWRETPHVTAALEDLYTKAAVGAGTTTDATWAGPLAGYGIASEALTLLRGASILGALEPRMRRIPFHAKVPRETGTGTGGAWIGQGLVTPVAKTAYDMLTQEAYKAGTIVVLSKELLKVSDPDAERTIRETVVNGLASFVDQQFLLPTVTLVADLRPAAITNGATEVTTTGTTAAQINADLGALLAAVTTPGPRTWIMRQGTASRIAATIGGTAAIDVPRTLFGIPLILSANSPAQITLLDPSQILYSDNGAIELSRSEQAAISMSDTPMSPPDATVVMNSLWQLNLWAIRAIRWLAYQRAQAGSVAWMTVAY
jgi:hypothetical protein